MSLGTPDLIISGIMLLSILIGVIRGFVKESISLVSWVIAIGLAIVYVNPLSAHMTFTKIGFVRNLSAFLIIFVGTVFVGALINYFVGGFIRKTPFSMPDRVLGSAFGALRGVFVATMLILLGGLTSLPEELWWQESYAIEHFQEIAIWVKDRFPDEIAKVFRFTEETEIKQVSKGSM
ncbi:MAG: CvpA family protein [Proteobacteria bacterium]|nr:CvpA family protein [Pseudomonadota bacterium]